MIVLDLELKEIYGFNDFHINFSYPKRLSIRLSIRNI